MVTRSYRGLIKHGSMMVHVDRRISRLDYLAHWFEKPSEDLLKSLYDLSRVDDILKELNGRYKAWLKKSKSWMKICYLETLEESTVTRAR